MAKAKKSADETTQLQNRITLLEKQVDAQRATINSLQKRIVEEIDNASHWRSLAESYENETV
jgi:uncharacterized coiled-coil protein SlyX